MKTPAISRLLKYSKFLYLKIITKEYSVNKFQFITTAEHKCTADEAKERLILLPG